MIEKKNVVFATANQLARMIRDREVSALQILDVHLVQIDKYNAQLHAIVNLDVERARKKAIEADEAMTMAKGENWGVLHGVPIKIKDALETKGLLTICILQTLANYIP